MVVQPVPGDLLRRAEAWAAWRDELIADGRSLEEAEYWLDVEFVQPCPEDRPTED